MPCHARHRAQWPPTRMVVHGLRGIQPGYQEPIQEFELQVCNTISSTVDLWIFRSARSLKRSAAALWSLDTACTASELCLDIDSMCLSSELLPLVRVPEIVGARSLHSFTRGPVSIIAGAWIAVQSAVEPGIAHACQISEITQVFTQQSWHIRMLASESFELDESFETTWFSKPMCELAGDYMLIDAESVHLSELHVVREGPLLRLRYLW